MLKPKPQPKLWQTIKVPMATYINLAALRTELLYRGTDALPERLRPIVPSTSLAGTVDLALEVLTQLLRDEDVRRANAKTTKKRR